ncbi:MAG: ATP-grasp domain-containing protein, partial [Promethearchaeota archaeon]
LIERPEELENEWPSHDDGFLAVSPYLEPSIPLNINACVFRDGTVTLHGPSVQLIGLNRITNRTFGYCGNDFARITEFDVSMINNLEEITISAGLWLHSNGYLGAFGVDALFCKGKLYLTEINPRFQGSSSMSARIDKELDRPDVFIEHIAAFLDLPAPKKISLYELVKEQPPLAHIYCHNLGPDSIYCSSITTDELEIECALIPSTNIAVLQDAITFEAIFNKPVTINGMLLDNGIEEEIVSISKCLYPELKWTKKESNKQMEFKLEDY